MMVRLMTRQALGTCWFSNYTCLYRYCSSSSVVHSWRSGLDHDSFCDPPPRVAIPDRTVAITDCSPHDGPNEFSPSCWCRVSRFLALKLPLHYQTLHGILVTNHVPKEIENQYCYKSFNQIKTRKIKSQVISQLKDKCTVKICATILAVNKAFVLFN